MKLIHLSDLHLGKRIFGVSLMEDQAFILQRILEAVRTERPEAVIIAGDVYDKPVPPAEAVQLFDRFIACLSEMGIKILLISGNHDSPERLAFGRQLLQNTGMYVSPVFQGGLKRVCLEDEFGPVWFYLMPFLKPSIVRRAYEEEEILTYQDGVRAALSHTDVDPCLRNVLVAHQFVTGAVCCESEELSVGGVDQIDGGLFDAFDYVALGHLHSPQRVGRDTMRYCGTALKYSFSEASQTKSLTVVELEEKGRIKLRFLPLSPLRDMRCLKGSYEALMKAGLQGGKEKEDYLSVVLTDEEDIIDGMQKLRTVYPNLLRLSYENERTRFDQDITGFPERENKTELALFEEFYQLQNNQSMTPEQREYIRGLLEDMKG